MSSCRHTPPSHPDPTTRPVRTLCALALSVAFSAHSRQLCVGVVLFSCLPATLQPFYSVPSQNHAKTKLPAVENKTTVGVSGGGVVVFCFILTQRWSLLSPRLRPWLSGWSFHFWSAPFHALCAELIQLSHVGERALQDKWHLRREDMGTCNLQSAGKNGQAAAQAEPERPSGMGCVNSGCNRGRGVRAPRLRRRWLCCGWAGLVPASVQSRAWCRAPLSCAGAGRMLHSSCPCVVGRPVVVRSRQPQVARARGRRVRAKGVAFLTAATLFISAETVSVRPAGLAVPTQLIARRPSGRAPAGCCRRRGPQ